MGAGRAEPRSSLPLPVVPHDGGGQHTREKPTKLRQRVEEGSVVRLHVGALRGNVRISRGWVSGASGLAAPWSRPARPVAFCRMRLCVCMHVHGQKPSLTSMTVHCSTTMVSLAGGEGLLSSYTNSPSNDRGTGSPGKKQRRQHAVKYSCSQRSAGEADSVSGERGRGGEGRRGEEWGGGGGHGPNRKRRIYFDSMRKDNKSEGEEEKARNSDRGCFVTHIRHLKNRTSV